MAMSNTTPERFKLVFTVPPSALQACKHAVFVTGAGTYPGNTYGSVSFETPGTGYFTPGPGATPYIGTVGKEERVEEVRVEILVVGRDVVKAAVGALRRAHPYEVVAYEVYKLEDF